MCIRDSCKTKRIEASDPLPRQEAATETKPKSEHHGSPAKTRTPPSCWLERGATDARSWDTSAATAQKTKVVTGVRKRASSNRGRTPNSLGSFQPWRTRKAVPKTSRTGRGFSTRQVMNKSGSGQSVTAQQRGQFFRIPQGLKQWSRCSFPKTKMTAAQAAQTAAENKASWA